MAGLEHEPHSRRIRGELGIGSWHVPFSVNEDESGSGRDHIF